MGEQKSSAEKPAEDQTPVSKAGSKDEHDKKQTTKPDKLDKDNDKNDKLKDKEDKKRKLDDENETNTESPKKKKANTTEPTKFVFGQSTPFGKIGGFGGFSKVSNKGKDTKGESKAAPIFGSGSTFGDAFKKALNQKSIFDGKPSRSASKTSKEVHASEKKIITSETVYDTVHLEKKEMKSGEEGETTLYQVKAKLYRMDLKQITEGWKERGLGVLKMNRMKKSTDSYKARLIMRQMGNLKLILNLPIVKNMKVMKGMTGSFSGKKFIRIQTVEGGEPIQYAVKIGQIDNVEKMYETIVGEIPK